MITGKSWRFLAVGMGLGLGLLPTPGCVARESAPVVVALPPPAVEVVTPSASSTSCTISGDGELVENEYSEHTDFGVFATARAAASGDPELHIKQTKAVAVTWSAFPQAHDASAPPVAAIALGGEKRISLHAYAKLTGRRFQLRTTGEVIADRMWIDRGVPVEVVGTNHGEIVVRRATDFDSPAFFEATVACGMMAYDPKPIDPPNDDYADDGVSPVGDRVELRSYPGGDTFVTVHPGEMSISFTVKETKADWLHVRWHERGLGLDGWVKKAEMDEGGGSGIGLGGIGTSGGRGRPSRVVIVKRPTAVLLGRDHHPFVDAMYEVGAVLEVWSTQDDLLSVTFEDRAIETPHGFWIASAAIEDR